MVDERRKFGDRGEDLATAFFSSHGFRIVQRNWTSRVGEIDLICEKNGVTHFVEVKTRRTLEYGNPEEAVTPTKLRHVRYAVESYLRSVSTPPKDYQIDVLAITALPGQKPEFHYVEGV